MILKNQNIFVPIKPSDISGCVAYYDLNGNSIDSIGTQNGTDYNITYVPGRINQSANFNASLDPKSRIELGITDFGLTTSQKMSLSAWIYWTDNSSYDSICDNENYRTGGTTQQGWIFRTFFDLSISTGIGNKVSGLGGTFTTVQSSEKITLNKWHHIVFTWDGLTMKQYIDGENDVNTSTRDALTSPISFGSVICSIGGIRSTGNFTGNIQEFSIFNKALSQVEITQLYNFGKSKFKILQSSNSNNIIIKEAT